MKTAYCSTEEPQTDFTEISTERLSLIWQDIEEGHGEATDKERQTLLLEAMHRMQWAVVSGDIDADLTGKELQGRAGATWAAQKADADGEEWDGAGRIRPDRRMKGHSMKDPQKMTNAELVIEFYQHLEPDRVARLVDEMGLRFRQYVDAFDLPQHDTRRELPKRHRD